VGILTRTRGITVHQKSCPRWILDPDRQLEVTWDEQSRFSRPITIRVSSSDRPGMLARMTCIFTNHHANILQAHCKVIRRNRAMNTFEVLIRDAEQLRCIRNEITQLSGVISVERL
jgi:GTP pyrophosphokinase